MKNFYYLHIIITSIVILSTFLKQIACHTYRANNPHDKDAMDVISNRHVGVARCRLFCFKELMGPRLLYQDINSVSYECKNTSISCNHCYEMCEKISHNKQEAMTICNYENHMCFGGCRTACKHRFLSAEKQFIGKKVL